VIKYLHVTSDYMYYFWFYENVRIVFKRKTWMELC